MQTPFRLMFLTFFLASALLVSGCGGGGDDGGSNTDNGGSQGGVVLDTTSVVTVSGKTLTVEKTDGGMRVAGQNKILLVEIYGYSCPHCEAAIPGYNRLQSKYPNDVYILTFESYGLDNASLLTFAQSHDMQYDTVAKENAGNAIAFFQEITGYANEGVPVLAVFNRDGTLVKYYPPMDLPEEDVDAVIQSLL